jgi:RHS repeat-associated protein
VNQKFTGKERDVETGLDYFGARYLSSAQGRWTSPDWSATPEAVPYGTLSDPQTLNLYGYVRNNPLGKPDVDGHGDGDSLWSRISDYWTGVGKGWVNGHIENGTLLGKAMQKVGVQQQVATNQNQATGMGDSDTVVGVAAMVIPGPKGAKAEELPNDAIVVRGGLNKPENFEKGSGVTIDANGKLQGVSVNSAAGKSEAELSKGIPNNQVGVTTVGAVREAGGNVTPSGTAANPNHCDMCGVSAQKASELMTVKPNPTKQPNQ